MSINPDKPMPKKAVAVFDEIPYASITDNTLRMLEREDIDGICRFKDRTHIPAGWLIAQMGLSGYKIGDAQVSEEDANIIVNTGKATLGHFAQLVSYIKMQVRDRLGIMLHESHDLY